MGGTTISLTGKNPDKLLYKIARRVADYRGVMQPDSAIMLYNPTTKEQKLYKIDYANEEKFRSGEFTLSEVEELGRGAGIAVAVAKMGNKPKKDEWIGMVHLHT